MAECMVRNVTEKDHLPTISLEVSQEIEMPATTHNLYRWLAEDPGTSPMTATNESNVLRDAAVSVGCPDQVNGPRGVHVEIIEEPEHKSKFRYEKENRLAGRIEGVRSTSERKTFPTIKIHGYQGPAYVVVSLVIVGPPYYPHPHNLEGKFCKKGVCVKEIDDPGMICCFTDLRIQCVRRQDAKDSLAQRESLRIDPYGTGYLCRRINYNAVRLCFQVLLPDSNGKFCIPVLPVISTPIDNKAVSDLVIMKLSHYSAPASGGQDVILLCGQVKKNDIEIVFFEKNENEITWSATGKFSPLDVHYKVAISFKTPAYRNPDIRKKVKCFIALRRPSDHPSYIMSKPIEFVFIPSRPDPEGTALKHLKFEGLRRTILQMGELICSQNSSAVSQLHPIYVNLNQFDLPPSTSTRESANEKENASTSAKSTAIPNIQGTAAGKPTPEQVAPQENTRQLQDDNEEVAGDNTFINFSDLEFTSRDLDGNLSGMTIDSLSEFMSLVSVGLIDEEMNSQENDVSVLLQYCESNA